MSIRWPLASDRAERTIEPPFWLPLLAGLPLLLALLWLAAPLLGQGAATLSRTGFVQTFLVWFLPLTALQRWLWRRGLSGWAMVGVLLPGTYLMALSGRGLNLWLQASLAGRALPEGDWALVLRGLEGPWLALVAYSALHAAVAHYVALNEAKVRHQQALALARDAELRALRYQLQPHFMFNTLNAISALVADGRGPDAQRMLARLGDFMRATLDGAQGHEVTLADEVSLTEAYLEIEKARLGDRLQVRWQIGPGLLAARVPHLLLQPLVENAIRHGIAPRHEPGRLEILVSAESDRLTLELSNDRPSAALPLATPSGSEQAVGLRNVRERLMQLHPQASELDAGVLPDGRYGVRLSFPLRLQARSSP
jgi:two-component system sensor histidine kinase AlgZ